MKRILISLLFLVSTTLFAQVDYTIVYDASAAIQAGTKLHDAEKFTEALKEYRKVDELDPSYPDAQYEIAMSLVRLEKKDSLYAHFERLQKNGVMKKQPTLFTLYGSFLSDEKKYEESEKIFLEGAKVIPNSTNHLYNLAILYYRQEQFQKCIDVLKKIVAQNPNASSAHYLLGTIAMDSGKIVEGSMALMSYLAVAPTGRYTKNAIMKLNAKFGENYLEKKNYVFSKSGDNFEELETILRNQLPLRKGYKVESKIDDIVTRQMQAVIEYCQTHKIEDGFFENTYMPWIKEIADKKYIEEFSYYMLIGLEGDLGKSLTSQKKKIVQFTEDYMAKDFWKSFAKRKMDIFGTEKEVMVYVQNGTPYLIGGVVNDKKEGRFKLLNKYENLSGELMFEDGEASGLQKYFNEEGKLVEEKSYSKGKMDGKRTSYYPAGTIELEENYKDSELNGKTTTYNVTGGISCEYSFLKGELDGQAICYHFDGSKKSEGTYSKGKREGKYTLYNKAGDITISESFVAGELKGKYQKFFDGKIVEEEADYDADIVVGSFKKYYSNKKLKAEYVYKDKKVFSSVEYYPTGMKSSESTYNEKGAILSTSYFDASGEKYYDEVFNSKEIKYIRQYTKSNPKPTEINLSRKAFEIKNLENKVLISGAFDKGLRHGTWKYLFATGQLNQESDYNKGEQEGLNKIYNKSGILTSVSNYKKDTIQGRSDVFDTRSLKKTFNYRKGELNGPFRTYFSDGKLESKGFYVDGDLYEKRKTYSQSGKLLFDETCYEGFVTATDIYNVKGEKEKTINYGGPSQNISYTMNSGTTSLTYTLKNGTLNGSYIRKDKFGKPITEAEYKNGNLTKTYKEYSPFETLEVERTYYNGEAMGVGKTYDFVGNLKIDTEYSFGEENGKSTRYYYNKSKMYEYTQAMDVTEGDYTYYNQKGEPILIVNYLDDIPQYYMKKSKTGELTDKVVIVNQTATIASNYPNGKVAIQFAINKGSRQGDFVINNELGKPEFTANYKNDLLENNRIQYYANGKIYCKEHFIQSDYDGPQEYFKEDGKPWVKSEYKNDELHGDTKIYTNGVLTVTKKYDSDYLVEIIKG
jgi:antitoxin component YwqK of YwqJK toxin-antitoxin module/Tfp pilus assembly protein PilF